MLLCNIVAGILCLVLIGFAAPRRSAHPQPDPFCHHRLGERAKVTLYRYPLTLRLIN